MTVGWWAELHDRFTLAVPVSWNMQRVGKADMALHVPISLGMGGSARLTKDFQLDVPVSLGISGGPGSGGVFGPGSFTIPASFELGATAAARYAAGFGLNVPAAITTAAGMRPSTEFGLPVPAAISMGGALRPITAHYTDDFIRADDATTLGANWVSQQGVMGIINNAAYPVTSAVSSAATWREPLSTDDGFATIIVAGFATANPANYPLRVFAFTGNDIQCYAQITPSSISIMTSTAWGTSGVSRATLTANVSVNDTVTLRRAGSVITAEINGVTVCTWNDTGAVMGRDASHRLVGVGGIALASYYARIGRFTAEG